MDERVAKPGNTDVRRGMWTSLAGVLLLPATVGLVAATPQGAREAAFELGVISCAAVSIRGGAQARRGLMAGADHPVLGVVASMLGLVVGVTAAIVAFWALIGVW